MIIITTNVIITTIVIITNRMMRLIPVSLSVEKIGSRWWEKRENGDARNFTTVLTAILRPPPSRCSTRFYFWPHFYALCNYFQTFLHFRGASSLPTAPLQHPSNIRQFFETLNFLAALKREGALKIQAVSPLCALYLIDRRYVAQSLSTVCALFEDMSR